MVVAAYPWARNWLHAAATSASPIRSALARRAELSYRLLTLVMRPPILGELDRSECNEIEAAMPSDVHPFLHRLVAATNAHDLDALVDCFTPDYRNEAPAHP